MRGLGGDPRVGELARVGIPAEQVRGSRRVVEERRPEALVVGEHAAAEDEGVDRRQQLEAVSPGVDPVDLALGAEDAAVERDLHARRSGSRRRSAHVCLREGMGRKCNRWLHIERLAQPLVADRWYARAVAWEEASGGARQDQQRGRHRRAARPGLGDRHRAAPRRSLVQRRSRDRPAPRRRHAPDLARARHLPRPRRGGRPAPQVRLPLAAPEDNEPGDGTSTLVGFVLAPEGSGTRLRVVESGFQRLAWPEDGQGPIRRRERRRLGPRARPTPRLRSQPRQQPDSS